jgi:hypothetical protein
MPTRQSKFLSQVVSFLTKIRAEAYPYNFYIAPVTDEGLNKRFYCQSSTFEFLMKHNFDFNKLFYEGLHFISKEDQNAIQKTKKAAKIKDKFRSNSLDHDKEF